MPNRIMDLPYLKRSLAASTASDNRRPSDSAVGPTRKRCRSRAMPALPDSFLRRENATNGAQRSRQELRLLHFRACGEPSHRARAGRNARGCGRAVPCRRVGSAADGAGEERHALGQRRSHPVGSQWCLGPPSGLALAFRRLPVGGARDGSGGDERGEGRCLGSGVRGG